VTDHIVVGDRVLLDISFRAAWARLGILGWDGVLLGASEEAYGESIAGLVKLAGPAAGLTRLAGVGLENLAETDDCAHIALQWEAIAAAGIRAVAAAVAGGAVLASGIAASRSPACVRGGECGQGRCPGGRTGRGGAVKTGRLGQVGKSPSLIAFGQQDPGMFTRSAATAADRAEACLSRASAASR